jgi:hypothetical protein
MEHKNCSRSTNRGCTIVRGARPYSNCVSSTFQLNQFPSADGGMDWKGAEIVDLVYSAIDCRRPFFSEVSLSAATL